MYNAPPTQRKSSEWEAEDISNKSHSAETGIFGVVGASEKYATKKKWMHFAKKCRLANIMLSKDKTCNKKIRKRGKT